MQHNTITNIIMQGMAIQQNTIQGDLIQDKTRQCNKWQDNEIPQYTTMQCETA